MPDEFHRPHQPVGRCTADTHVVWFGLANLATAAVLVRLAADGFASLWCFYAALASGGIAVYIRVGGAEPTDGGIVLPEPAPVPRS